MTIIEAIYELIQGVTPNIYPVTADDNTDRPYILYAITNSEPQRTLRGSGSLTKHSLQIEAHTETQIEASSLLASIKVILDGYSGGMIHRCFYVDEDTPDTDDGYQETQTYDLWAKNTDANYGIITTGENSVSLIACENVLTLDCNGLTLNGEEVGSGEGVPGSGTVTSVDVSPGDTGLSTVGGPITSTGTITIGGTLNIQHGGTGATTEQGARDALELGELATLDTVTIDQVDGLQTALDGKIRSVNGDSGPDVIIEADTIGAEEAGTAVALMTSHLAAGDPHTQYAPKASPALTGTPTAPTATGGTNTTQIATTAFVSSAVSGLGSTYQPLDSDLTAIAALSTTTFGRALLTQADAAATRSTLSVPSGTGTVSGTNTGDQDLSSYATTAAVAAGYQPLDTELTALASTTSAANKLPYFTGSGTATVTDLTSAGRAILDDADATAQRVTLGLSTFAGSVFVSSPTDGTLVLSAKAAFAFTISQIRGLKTSSGTLSLAVQINGTNVTSLSGLSVTSTPQDVSATGANSVSVGDRVTVVISSSSSPTNLEFTLSVTR